MRNTLGLLKSMVQSKLYGTPYKLNFQITGACNSRCVTCNIWKEYREDPDMVKRELTLDEITKVFQKLPKTISWMSLTGGEPFMRKDFPQIIDSAINNVQNLRLLTTPTSGLYQGRTIKAAEELIQKKHPDMVFTFSVDGPEEIHDQIRGIKGGFKRTWGTYTKVREIIENDQNFKVGIQTTVSANNVKVLYPFLKDLLDDGHMVAITVAHDAYLYKNVSDKSHSPKESIKEFEDLIAMFRKRLSFMSPVSMIQRQYMANIPKFLRNPAKMVVPCESLRSSFSLGPQGNITPCLMWGNRLGNMRDQDYDIKLKWNSETYHKTRDTIEKEKCPICYTPCEAYQSLFWATMKGKMIPR